MLVYFNKCGLFNGLKVISGLYNQSFYEKYVLLYDYLLLDLKKSIYLINGGQLCLHYRSCGSCIFVRYYFVRRNLRVIVQLKGGYVVYSLTGGIMLIRMLGRGMRFWKRERRGLSVVDFVIPIIKRKIKLVIRYFKIKVIKLFLCTYVKRYFVRRLFHKRLWFYLRKNKYVYDRIPRSHNSLDSAKRWRKRPVK